MLVDYGARSISKSRPLCKKTEVRYETPAPVVVQNCRGPSPLLLSLATPAVARAAVRGRSEVAAALLVQLPVVMS
jgi:hypothetical protein